MDPVTLGLIGGSAVANVAMSLFQHQQDVEAARQRGQITDAEAQNILNAFQKMKDATELPPGEAPILSPAELTIIGKYAPEVSQHVQENRPDIVNDSQQGRQAQMNALDQMRSMSLQGSDATSQAATENAKFAADSANRQRQNQILQGYANRGLLTGNTAMGAELSGAQDAAVAERQAALQAAADAQSRRANSLQNYGNMAGQIRSGDTDVSKSNASIMNAYNERMANSMNDYNKYVSNTRNAAQEYNLKVQQDIANKNAESRADMANTNALNQFKQQGVRRDALNALTAGQYDASKNAATLRAGGRIQANKDVNAADTTRNAGIAGSLNQAGSQYTAQSNLEQYGKPKKTPGTFNYD